MTSRVSSSRSFCSRERSGLKPAVSASAPGLLDRAQEGGDALVGAAQLEDLLDHGAVLAHELVGALVLGVAVVDLLHLDAQLVAVAGLRRARPGRDAGRRRSPPAAPFGSWPRSITSATTPMRPNSPSLARQQEDAILLAGVDRQGRGDAGEDDRFVKWNQKKGHGQIQFL